MCEACPQKDVTYHLISSSASASAGA
jgi:hypothetical protein